MLIECTIRRARGSSVSFGDTVYRFGPGGGPHVAEVKNPEHIRRLLAVTSSFRAFQSADAGSFDAEFDPIEGPSAASGQSLRQSPSAPPPVQQPAAAPATSRRGRPRKVLSSG